MPIDSPRQIASRLPSPWQADNTSASTLAQTDGSPLREQDSLVANAPRRDVLQTAIGSSPSPHTAAPQPVDILKEWEQAPNISPMEQQQRSCVASRLRDLAGGENSRQRGFLRRSSFIDVPSALRVGGNLDLHGCTSLSSLPAHLQVGGDLYLSNCTSLSSLPAHLQVGGDLYLSNCTSLSSLPAHLQVGRDLYLNGCTSLSSLPAGLQVGRGLYLNGCTSLSSLPAGLQVGGDLYLGGCTSLSNLPSGLQVDKDLDLEGCTSLTALPPNILHWRRRNDGLPHTIYLENSGLGGETRRRLQAWFAAQGSDCGLRFHFSETSATGLSDFDGLQEAVAFWRPAAGAEGAHPAQEPVGSMPTAASQNRVLTALSPEDQHTLKQFLGGLRGTAEYKSSAGRPHMQARVGRLLDSLKDARLAGTVLVLLHNAMATCGDRLIRGLDEVEQFVVVERATHSGDAQALRRLGESLLRLEVVHAHAARKVQSLVCVDEVEVYLVYETRLADKLHLPFATRQMLYSEEVTAEDLASAEIDARTATADAARLDAWLSGWSPWQKHLRRKEADAVRQGGYDRLAAVSDEAHAAALCPFTLASFAQMRQPVSLSDAGVPIIAEFDSLLTGWVEDDRHPINRRPFALTQLRRATLPDK